jgi:hypothetical protein
MSATRELDQASLHPLLMPNMAAAASPGEVFTFARELGLYEVISLAPTG